jgi:hypothetical protein
MSFTARFIIAPDMFIGWRVIGDVGWRANHWAIAARSYVCVSDMMTGSVINSRVMGQQS